MTAATIIFAREDLSIPGAVEPPSERGVAKEARFFKLLRETSPDVIVLDLSRDPTRGVAAILKIRARSPVPILAVCDLGNPSAEEFRIAGAADCIPTPIELYLLNDRLQQIIRVTRAAASRFTSGATAFVFDGITFDPYRDLLAGANDATVALTTSESRLLQHFVSRPWRLCPRAELTAVLYGSSRPAGDRAIDIIINRLCRKLALLREAGARTLIKTEFRRGYLFVAAVATAEEWSAGDAAA